MKKTIISLLFILLSQIFWGQTKKDTCKACKPQEIKNIKITYERLIAKRDFPRPFSYKTDTYLLINDSIAQYVLDYDTKIVRKDNYQTKINFLKYTNNYNFKTNEMEEFRDLDGLIITAKWKPKYHWKITDETKTINGFKVRKAVTESIEIAKGEPSYYGKVYAWFTEEIPIPVGPERYVGLPGLILEIEYENTNVKTTVKSIEYNTQTEFKPTPKKAIPVEDPDDVIFIVHKHPEKIKKLKKQYGKSSFFSFFK